MTNLPIKPMPTEPTTKLANRRTAIAIVLGLTLLSGVVHGYLDGRWRPAEDLVATGFRISELPDRCGDWVMTDNPPLDEAANEMLRCYGSDVRVYQNEKTNAFVRVALLYGPRGPIAIHTPEVCFSSAGTERTRDRLAETVSVGDTEHSLWSVEFSRAPNPDPAIDAWYAWTDGESPWKAAESPRYWVTEHLYKIQVAGPVSQGDQQPCRDFLQAFLPQVERVIGQ